MMIETVLLSPDRTRPSEQSIDAATLQAAAHKVQEAFDVLLSKDSKLAEILANILSRGAKMVVFGGWARDRLFEHLRGRQLESRDIDFVVESEFDVAEFFPAGARVNPFGGVGIAGEVMPLEAWNLQKTFLFQRHKKQASFASLPSTADYDVNALLFFPAQCHGAPLLMDAGAGNALKSKRIDFMADEVAQPKIQAARAVILATKLELAPSEAICDFVQDVCESTRVAKEVHNAVDTYCPAEFREKAARMLEQIRQGSLGGRPKTEFFFHCWGVFEGGGVRAAAHAGAYTAAKRAGVTFGRVAGTSGGSIVASLVAAGASPSYLRAHLQALEFGPLLEEPSTKQVVFEQKPSVLTRVVRPITWGRVRTGADVAVYGGLHNSRPLGDWLEERLVDLVRRNDTTNRTPVRFEELPVPLYVVATDLSTGRPKIWSSDTTGGESVALAVRYSCTIPFFFQPAPAGTAIYVDGGAVSNLPAYVLNQISAAGERDVLPRILAFRLVEDDAGGTPVRDVVDFAKRLSAAVINSASEIQLQLQSNVYPVHVKTGKIRSTDFAVDEDGKRFLFWRGMRAAREFFDQERLAARRPDATAQEFQGFDEKMLLVVRQIHLCKRAFLAVGSDTYWIDHVFPSLLLLARAGVAITVVVSSAEHIAPALRAQETRRRQLLGLLGAKVTEAERLPFSGFAFDLGTERASAILTYLPQDASRDAMYEYERVRLYTADSDPVIMQIVADHVAAYTTWTRSMSLSLDYAQCDRQKLISRLRRLPAYERAQIHVDRIEVTDHIVVMQRRVKEFKALQVRSLMADLASSGYDFFGPLQVQLASGKSSIVTPPVLERHSGSLVVIEGNARLHHCFANGIEQVEALVIDGVTDQLPSDGRFPLGNVRLVSSTTSMVDNYLNLRKSQYRHIERAVHESYD